MKSEDFITTAGKIVGFGDAGSRSATSRAYYGAFNLAIDIVCEITNIRQRSQFPGNHALPLRCLSKSKHPDAREAGDLLGSLQSRRIKADYRIEEAEPNLQSYGQYSVIQADTCKGHLEALRAACLTNNTMKADFIAATKSVFSLAGH